MDVAIAAMLALIQLLSGSAWAGLFAKTWKESVRARFFMVLSAISLVLVILQAFHAHQSSEENRKSLFGDAERPPFVSVISLPGNTRFVRVNSSGYPAYSTSIQLYD
jgi:hypothetical protein